MKKRILLVCPTSPRESFYGLHNYIINLGKGVKKRYDVEIFCVAKKPKENAAFDGIKLNEFKETKIPFGIHCYSQDLINALKNSDADIVHVSGYNTLGPLLAIMGKKKTQKLVITIASSKSSSKFREALWWPYTLFLKMNEKKIDYFIAASIFERDIFSKIFKNSKFKVIAAGIKETKSRPTKIKKLVTTGGRLVKNKGYQQVIKAFAEVIKKDPEFKLEIFGDGQYKKNLETLVKKLGLESNVSFIGPLTHEGTIDKIKSSLVFVFLSRYEGQGIITGEAVKAGTPTIVSNNTSITELANYGLAYSFNSGNKKGIAEMIIKISKNPKKYAPKKKGINSCYLTMTIKDTVKETEKLYQKLLK